MKTVTSIVEEFEKLQVEESGKWRVDRNVAKAFLKDQLSSLLTELHEG